MFVSFSLIGKNPNHRITAQTVFIRGNIVINNANPSTLDDENVPFGENAKLTHFHTAKTLSK